MGSWEQDDSCGRNYNYEKEEKWEQSKNTAKYAVLSLVIACGLIFALVFSIQDIKLRLLGNAIETEFKTGTTLTGVNEDGNEVKVFYDKISYVTTTLHGNDSNNVQYNRSTYGKGRVTAFKDKDDVVHIVPLKFSMLSPLKKQAITVYYYGDDLNSARAINAIWFWVVVYIILIPLFILCVRATYRKMYPKSHIKMLAD